MASRPARRTTASARLCAGGFLGFVYQYHHLLPEFSAIENVMLPQMLNGRSRGEARARAAELLAMVQLKDRSDHRPGRLSGGEQQRVAIARAVANAPRVLLADEPTGNLDASTADTVFRQLLALVRETGMAALVATHNHDLAARMDRTVTLKEGRRASCRPRRARRRIYGRHSPSLRSGRQIRFRLVFHKMSAQ